MVADNFKINSKVKKAQIKSKVTLIIQDRKNANLLVELLDDLNRPSENQSVLSVLQSGLTRIWEALIKNGDLRPPPEVEDTESTTPVEKYRSWLWNQFDLSFDRMFDLFSYCPESLDNRVRNVREMALVISMKWIASFHEKHFPSKPHWSGLDVKRFRLVLQSLLTPDYKKRTLIHRFSEFMDYADVKLQVIQGLFKLIKKGGSSDPVFLDNVISMLEILNFGSGFQKVTLICHGPTGESTYEHSDEIAFKAFNSLWEEFLKLPLPVEHYKRVLVLLTDKVMPQLARPLLLTDFLMNSYNVGGAISLLSLNGVFRLMTDHHLEYPDFYPKLYSLFTSETLGAKYRARFFYSADLFLRSSHLPEYLVAAFVKRLSRLSLKASPDACLLIFRFIGNLLLRHKSLIKMIDGKNSEIDPYLEEESDLSKCKAIESSLWEIQTLCSHCLPQVSAGAKFIWKKLPEMEWDLTEVLELNLKEIMEKECKKKVFVNVPLNYERPIMAKFPKNDLTSKYFSSC